MLKGFKSFIALLLLCWGWGSAALAEMPKTPEGRINDFAQALSPTAKETLENLSQTLEAKQGAQLAVVTVPSLDGMSVEEYANKLFNLWGIGHKGKDDGVLFLIAPTEHKVRIEVGYGLEGVLNDGKTGRILDESVVPFFKAGDYTLGIVSGAQRIVATLTGDESQVTIAPPAAPPDVPLGWKEKLLILGFFGLFVGLGFLAVGIGLRGDKFYILWGGGFGGIPLGMSFLFGYAMKFPIYILPALGGVMLLVGLIFGKKLSKAMKSSSGKRSSGGSGGGGFSSWSSGSSSSSSSSGSSFGGGSSGGGGSSRSW